MSHVASVFTTAGESLVSKRCSELGCIPINKDVPATYEKNGAIAINNRNRINAFIANLSNPAFLYRVLIVDNYYAIGDDGDGYGIYWGAFIGGEMHTLGKPEEFRWSTSPVGSNLWPRSGSGLVYRGENNGVLFEFHGAFAYLDLCLLGTYFNSTTGVQDQIDNDCAQTLLKCQNLVDPDQDPHGLKSHFDLMFPIGRDGVVFQNGAGSSYTDSPVTHSLYTFYLSGIAYKVDENQSLQHLVIKAGNSGYPMEKMFSLVQGGVLHIVEAYCPNGTFVHLGPSGSGALSSTAADVKVQHAQLDGDFGSSNVLLLDCEAATSGTRVYMDVNTTLIPPYHNKQLIRRLESTENDLSTQPDIQVNIRNLDFVEQCAYPQREVRGYPSAAAEHFYPMPTVSGLKLHLRASELDLNDLDDVSSITDLAGVQTLTAVGSGPKFIKHGTNWRPTFDFNYSGSTSRHIVATSPVDLANGLSSLFIACVYTEKQASLANDGYICSCRNSNGTGGFYLMRLNGGKIRFNIGGASCDTVANIEPGRPTLIIANWDGAAIDLWVNGVKAEATAGSAVGSVTGHLVIGGVQTAATPTYVGCRGRIPEILIAETSFDVNTPDSGSDNAPLLSSWNSTAAGVVRYLRAQYGVW